MVLHRCGLRSLNNSYDYNRLRWVFESLFNTRVRFNKNGIWYKKKLRQILYRCDNEAVARAKTVQADYDFEGRLRLKGLDVDDEFKGLDVGLRAFVSFPHR